VLVGVRFRKRVEAFDQRTQEFYKWPSSAMIQESTGKGYHMIPLGFVPRKGINPAFEREWRIEFPEAERYLETCLSDTQLRCYIFCLQLFQVSYTHRFSAKTKLKLGYLRPSGVLQAGPQRD